MLRRAKRIQALAIIGVAVAAAVLVANLNIGDETTNASSATTTTQTADTSTTAPQDTSAGARAERAVTELADALRLGDVENLCRPNAIFTAAVIQDLNAGGQSCEVTVELSSVFTAPPALTVTGLSLHPDLATAQVHIAGGGTIPLDLVRTSVGWIVSFSDGVDPITAITQNS